MLNEAYIYLDSLSTPLFFECDHSFWSRTQFQKEKAARTVSCRCGAAEVSSCLLLNLLQKHSPGLPLPF